VPRAELFSWVLLTESTVRSLAAHVDCNYVILGFSKGASHVHRRNQDLWRRLWARLEVRAGAIEVLKVRAHMSPDQASATHADSLTYALNLVADGLAGQAAERPAVSSSIADEVLEADALSGKIVRRLTAVALHAATGRKPEDATPKGAQRLSCQSQGLQGGTSWTTQSGASSAFSPAQSAALIL